MSNVVYIKAFNSTITKFIDSLIESFPEEKVLKSTSIKINMVIKANAVVAIKVFKKYTTLFSEQIINQDEDFFLKMEIPNENLSFLEDVKNIYKYADDGTKKVIWKYISNLYKIAQMYK